MNKKVLTALIAALTVLAILATALAVTYTEDGGLVVNGDGTDDFTNLQPADPNATYVNVILPGDYDIPQYDEFGNLITPGPGPTFAPGEVLDVWLVGEDGTEQAVTLVHAGSRYCDVRVGRQHMHVPTASLRYEISENVPPERLYASVNAKRTGYATMHTRASERSDVVNRCTTNQMCLVVDIVRNYAKVWCMGSVGYIRISSLTFYGVPDENAEDCTMSYRGRTNTRNTINIRQNGKSTSRILGDVACGSPMVLFSESEDGWCEVEVAGWRCYVRNIYVTLNSALNSPTINESASDTQTPAPMIITQDEYSVTISDLTDIIFFDPASSGI